MRTIKNRFAVVVGVVAVLTSASVYLACDDTSSDTVKEPAPGSTGTTGPTTTPPPASTTTPDGGDGGPTDCVMNPKTHLEIINACTDAQKITKDPVLPLLLPDGGLPPL